MLMPYFGGQTKGIMVFFKVVYRKKKNLSKLYSLFKGTPVYHIMIIEHTFQIRWFKSLDTRRSGHGNLKP